MYQEPEELDDGYLSDLLAFIQLWRKSGEYTHIPCELWQYCENAIGDKKSEDSLLQAIEVNRVNYVLSCLNQLFLKACKITGYKLAYLIEALDFDSRDTEKGRIDSFFAELRAIFFLNNQKFAYIQPQKRKKKRKQCDIFATRNSKKFAVEVFHSSERTVLDLYRDKEFIDDLCNRFESKKSQVDASINLDSCQYGLFIYVMDRFTSNIRTSKHRFDENLRCVHNELKWGKQYYFAIVTGNTINGKAEDTIYPPLEPLVA